MLVAHGIVIQSVEQSVPTIEPTGVAVDPVMLKDIAMVFARESCKDNTRFLIYDFVSLTVVGASRVLNPAESPLHPDAHRVIRVGYLQPRCVEVIEALNLALDSGVVLEASI